MRLFAVALLPALFSLSALAQSPWTKSYSVSGRPMLDVQVDDAGVNTRSCGGCRTVSIQVDYRGGDPSQWSISELQGGNGIHFALKHKDVHTFLGGWHGHSPQVTIQTPAQTDLTLRSGDGGLSISGLHGTVDAHTGDGGIDGDDLAGALRLTTGDGGIHLRRAEGTLYATSGDGGITLEGKFSQFDVRSGDGGVQLRLLPGSVLSASSSVTTGDGSVNVNLPGDLRAEVDASTGDGSISSSFPMLTNTSARRDRSHIHGNLNGGGPLLRIHTGDGSVALSGS